MSNQHNPPPGVVLPRLAFTEGYLGRQAKFDVYGLNLVSHTDPIIYLSEDQPEVEIIMGVPAGCRITIKMASLDYQKECNEYCLIRALGPNYLFLLRPPYAGFYKFQIYALPADEAGPQFLGVYNYMIHQPTGKHGDRPFPKQYPPWKDGCYLHDPVSLPRGIRDNAVPFRMRIPKARDVQIKVGEDWHQLLPTSDPGEFQGFVSFSRGYPTGTKVKVNVKFAGNNYNTLLEYTI